MQFSSYVYFLLVVPVLRYGPNNHRFAYSSEKTGFTSVIISEGAQDDILSISREQFLRAMSFTGATTDDLLVSCSAAHSARTPCVSRSRAALSVARALRRHQHGGMRRRWRGVLVVDAQVRRGCGAAVRTVATVHADQLCRLLTWAATCHLAGQRGCRPIWIPGWTPGEPQIPIPLARPSCLRHATLLLHLAAAFDALRVRACVPV